MPKLRLKPKLAGETPAPAAAPTPAETPAPVPEAARPADTPPAATPASGETKAFRLKPKLSAAPAETSPATPAPEPAPAASAPTPVAPPASFAPAAPSENAAPPPMPAAEVPPPIPPPPRKPSSAPFPPPNAKPSDAPFPPPPPAAGGDKPKVAFKPKAPGEAPPTEGATAAPPPFPPPPGKFPPPPGVKPASPVAADKAAVAAAGKPASNKSHTAKLAVTGLAAVLVLGAAGMFFLGGDEPEPTPAPVTSAPTPPQNGSPVVDNPQSSQGKAVAKAADVVAKSNEARTLPDDDSLAPATNESAGATPETPAGTVTADAPAPVTPTPQVEAPKPPPPASVAFRAWVQNLRISSVRPGPPARALIGATTYEAGEVVEPRLGIIFEDYNNETRMIIFKDATGAIVERKI